MKVVLSGAVVSGGTGKLGGTVFQGSAFGNTAHNRFRPCPQNNATDRQGMQKALFRYIVSAWRSLTVVQQNRWIAFAFTPLSGFQTFVKVNLTYFRVNQILLLDPISFSGFVTPTIMDFFADSGTNTLTVKVDTNTVTPTTWQYFTFRCNYSAGVNRYIPSQFRQANRLPSMVGPFVLVTSGDDINQIIIAGTKQVFWYYLIDSVTGELSNYYEASCIAS